jgi:hypothetical protein
VFGVFLCIDLGGVQLVAKRDSLRVVFRKLGWDLCPGKAGQEGCACGSAGLDEENATIRDDHGIAFIG